MTDRLRVRRVLVGVLAWLLFGLCWSSALGRGVDGAAEGAAVLVLSSLAALVLTVAWQRHNKSIHRRKGARRACATDRRAFEHDRLGRRLDFEDRLDLVPEIVVSVSAGVKTYRGAP